MSRAIQDRVLVGLQRRMVQGSVTSQYIGQLLGLSTTQARAALKLLEYRGLVRSSRFKHNFSQTRYWNLTDAGRAEVIK